MTNADKKRVLIDFMKKAIQIVENYKKPYSDKMWAAFIGKTVEVLKPIEDREFRNFLYRILNNTAEFVNKHLNESEDH